MSKPDRESMPYRDCVGTAVFNAEGLVFIGRRKPEEDPEDSSEHEAPWQMPQGGIDKGESPRDAATRELFEETSIRSVELIAEAPGWIYYDLPDEALGIALKGKYRGQRQRWFAYRFTGNDSEINVTAPGDGSMPAEFDKWRWEQLEALPNLIVPFKKQAYLEVVTAFRELPAKLHAQMKTIGLIGGMSWESTAHYYAILNRETAKALGGLHSAPVIVHSVDFAPVAEMQSAGDWNGAGAQLAVIAQSLEAQGCGVIGLATNTMHICAPQIVAGLSVPFVHIAAPTAEALLADGIGKVGLLGTRFTMEKRFYIDELEQRGLEVLVPDVGITNLNGIIYEELCLGIVREELRHIYVEAIARLQARGAEAVILGCTEICMLIDDSVSPLPTYDTTELQAKALVAAALA